MRDQKESKFVWSVAIISMFVIVALRCFDSAMATEPDSTFLYNRAYQLLDCLKNGYWPFLYYNDVGGIGYGSPIFYGQLTLLPFLPFLGSISSFLKVYFLVCVVVNFFGFRFLVKRFSSYATLSACFYIVGVPFIFFLATGMYPAALATGISWYFFAFCVDYFRDGKGFAFVILTYFLVWQTNFNSVVFATIVCFLLFLKYFDRKRFRDYARLFICVWYIILFDIVNILTHLDALRLVDFSSWFLGDMSSERVVFSSLPFGGFFFRNLMAVFGDFDRCCGFLSFGALLVLVRGILGSWRKESSHFRFLVSLVVWVVAIGYVVGFRDHWGIVYQATQPFFQFPIRYFILVFGFVVLILSRVIKPGKLTAVVLVLSVLDIFLVNPLTVASSEADPTFVYQRIVHGEYAGSNFVDGMSVYETYGKAVNSQNGYSYSFVNEYNGLTVDCSENAGGDVITLPKLYYYGYKAVGPNVETFVVHSGYSNYCEVAIGDYQGELRLQYHVSGVVMTCFWLQLFCLSRLCVWLLRFTINKVRVYYASSKRK